MGIKTEYKCDCCGHTQEEPKQMWNVEINYHHDSGASTYASKSKHLPVLWCRMCMIEKGILTGNEEERKPLEPLQITSIEDLVREIVRDEMSNQ